MRRYACEWRGPVTAPSGLGIASREYVHALRRQGISVKAVSSHSRAGAQGGQCPILIYHYPPQTIRMNKERKRFKRIILNSVWETTRIPNRWRPNMNRFDAVCVPSTQNKQAFRNSGVKVPIFIVPHGVNTKAYTPRNEKFPLPQAKGRFVFVSVFGFQHRKNPEALLRAYWEEFSASDNVLLVVKTNGYASHENEQWIKKTVQRYKEKLGLSKKTAPVVIIGRRLSTKQLKGIYTLGDVFVLPTKGEGVGLPFLESLASGVPVIATGWGGHMDFLNSGNSFLVKYKLQNPAVSMNSKHAISRRFRSLFAEKGQRWAEADLASLKNQMRYAYEHPHICRQKGQQGRKDALKLSWDKAGVALKRVISMNQY